MIIEFTFENFRSFKNETTLTLEADDISSGQEKLIRTDCDLKLLPSVGIFGANATGKSNIFKALACFKTATVNISVDKPTTDSPLWHPFTLDKQSISKPIFMQMIVWDQVLKLEYRYGFRINPKQILEEWLFIKSKTKKDYQEQKIFFRRLQEFEFGKDYQEEFEQSSQRVNQKLLALPVLAEFNHQIAKDILSLFNKIVVIEDNDQKTISEALAICGQDKDILEQVNQFLAKSDTAISELTVDAKVIPQKTFQPMSETTLDVKDTLGRE